MGKTPDRFPGTREEDEIELVEDTTDPTVEGRMRYVSGSFKLRDASGVFDPRSGGGGITEPTHEGLDRLTHWVNETSFDELIYTGNRLDQVITWTSAAKTLKIREDILTYSGSKVTQVVTIQYDGAGVEKERNTEVFSYTGNRLDDVTRTHV